jgi:hypothetical protein
MIQIIDMQSKEEEEETKVFNDMEEVNWKLIILLISAFVLVNFGVILIIYDCIATDLTKYIDSTQGNLSKNLWWKI